MPNFPAETTALLLSLASTAGLGQWGADDVAQTEIDGALARRGGQVAVALSGDGIDGIAVDVSHSGSHVSTDTGVRYELALAGGVASANRLRLVELHGAWAVSLDDERCAWCEDEDARTVMDCALLTEAPTLAQVDATYSLQVDEDGPGVRLARTGTAQGGQPAEDWVVCETDQALATVIAFRGLDRLEDQPESVTAAISVGSLAP